MDESDANNENISNRWANKEGDNFNVSVESYDAQASQAMPSAFTNSKLTLHGKTFSKW